MRYIVHNHYGKTYSPVMARCTHEVSKQFRATRVHDHGPGCKGGTDCCDECRSHARDQTELTNVAIDVVYMKGGYGRPKIHETRHYVRTGVEVDPKGRPPTPEYIGTLLAANREHKKMLLDGWDSEKIEGYYRK